MTAASTLAGVRWGQIARHGDSRGSFREVWRDSQYPELSRDLTGVDAARFAQANVSTSASGVLRGLHYHRRQLDHWVVLDGRAFVALVDIRPTARGGDPVVECREVGADATVTIPSGVAHGFLALTNLTLMYLVTNEYDGSDELGFRWDDDWANVPWPPAPREHKGEFPILSERDKKNPPLRDLIATLARS